MGIAGLGRLGRRHAEQLAFGTRGARLVSACSPVAEELAWTRAELGVATLHESFGVSVRDPELDAVVLVTPTSLHAEQTIAALEAGKHVFVDKPLALDVEDCERVAAAARRHPGLVAMVGFVRRFDPSYARAQADITAGAIGRPFIVRSQTCDQNDPSGFFVKFAPTSGRLFMDCSVHDIDLARWMLGRPRALRVFATGSIAIHEGLRPLGDIDNGIAVVEFEEGRRALRGRGRLLRSLRRSIRPRNGGIRRQLPGRPALARRIGRRHRGYPNRRRDHAFASQQTGAIAVNTPAANTRCRCRSQGLS